MFIYKRMADYIFGCRSVGKKGNRSSDMPHRAGTSKWDIVLIVTYEIAKLQIKSVYETI